MGVAPAAYIAHDDHHRLVCMIMADLGSCWCCAAGAALARARGGVWCGGMVSDGAWGGGGGGAC